MEPTRGAKMYTYRLWYVPDTMAGPIDRAGLTEAPLIGIAAKWMPASTKGITKMPQVGCFFVIVRITATKMVVRIASTENAWSSWASAPGAVEPGPFTVNLTTVTDETSRMVRE